MTKPTPKGIYVRMPAELYELLRAEAEFEHRTMAGQVRHLLIEELDR